MGGREGGGKKEEKGKGEKEESEEEQKEKWEGKEVGRTNVFS